MIQVLRSLPEAQWKEFVANHPEGNIFHSPEMMEVFRRARGSHPEFWATAKNHQVLALMLPVRVSLTERPILRQWLSRSVVYGSVLVAPGQEAIEALAQLLTRYKQAVRGQVLFTELRNTSDLQSLQPALAECGFVYEEHLNFLIDLDRPPEAIFRDIGSRTRKNIRHALNQGRVEVEAVQEKRDIAACYDLLKRTYQRAQVPLADKTLFDSAFDLLGPRQMIRFTLAKVEGRPVAASVDLLYKDTIYGWYGGVDRDFRSYLPNEILTWDILKWGSENGFRVYDFGGAGDPEKEYGVRDFKAKFGGRKVNFGRNICVHSPLGLRLSKLGYRILRPVLFGGSKRRGSVA